MNVVAWLLFAFGLARLTVSLVNLIGRPYLPRDQAVEAAPGEVSVLIPARNEERNIGLLLADLTADGAGIREILVYDDRSTDRTVEIVRDCARTNPRIRLLSGGDLPVGWLGKSHACYRLAQQADGRFLLFLDADVRIRGRAVARAAHYVRRSSVAMLSLFPEQAMPDRGTQTVVPLMHWILLSLLPLVAVRRSPHPALAAANGQFLLFDAAVYRALQPHRQLRLRPVEDIAIARYLKGCGCCIAVLLGRKDVACRMYANRREAIDGFSRSFFGFFGGSEWLAWGFVVATTAAPWLAFGLLGEFPGLLYLLVIAFNRFAASRASGQPVVRNLTTAPFQQLAMVRIAWAASRAKRRKRLLWKGRNIYLNG